MIFLIKDKLRMRTRLIVRHTNNHFKEIFTVLFTTDLWLSSIYNNYNLTIKKLRQNRQKFEIFFVKFQASFLRRSLIYIYTYHKKLLYFQWFDSGDRQMIYTLIINILNEEPFYLLRPQGFSFQIVSEFIDTFAKFSNFMS